MGNHNLVDHSIEDVFQKGLQTFASKVDAGGDVFDEGVSRVRFLEVLDLAGKVALLLAATDAGVDVRGPSSGWSLSENGLDAINVVHSLIPGHPDVLEVSGGHPAETPYSSLKCVAALYGVFVKRGVVHQRGLVLCIVPTCDLVLCDCVSWGV